VDMDISMVHGKSVDMDMDMDGKFHIHGKPGNCGQTAVTWLLLTAYRKSSSYMTIPLPTPTRCDIRFSHALQTDRRYMVLKARANGRSKTVSACTLCCGSLCADC